MNLDPVQRAAQEQFAQRSGHYGKGHILAQVADVEAALPLLGLPAVADVLDVATGGGHTGLFFARLGHRVTLGDLTPAMLAQASGLAAEAGLRIETRQHPAEEMPYPEAAFDLVTCRIAAHHFNSPPAFLRETARVLRPGGRLLLIDGTVEDGEPEAEAWSHYVEKLRDASHNRLLTPRSWEGICAAAGLRVVHSVVTPFKQPDLEWYFDVAATPAASRAEVLRLVDEAPESARRLFQIRREDGKISWWWRRLTLVAAKG